MIKIDIPKLTKELQKSGIPKEKAIAIAVGINKSINETNSVSLKILNTKLYPSDFKMQN
jgi:hypothetical protein